MFQGLLIVCLRLPRVEHGTEWAQCTIYIVVRYADGLFIIVFLEFSSVYVREITKLHRKSTRSPVDDKMGQQEVLYFDRYAHKAN